MRFILLSRIPRIAKTLRDLLVLRCVPMPNDEKASSRPHAQKRGIPGGACKFRDRTRFTARGMVPPSRCQPRIRAMVRSLENFPELATFKMALRAQASRSAYSATSRWSASR